MDTLQPDETASPHHSEPETINTSRRRYLQGLLAASLIGLAGSLPLSRLASAAASPDQTLHIFMTLSQALTEHPALDATVSMRLLDALSQNVGDFVLRLPGLAQAISSGKLDTEQEKLALAILEAWYLGTVNHQVILYEHALMFQAAGDVLTIRSYCPNQPGFWAEKPNSTGATS